MASEFGSPERAKIDALKCINSLRAVRTFQDKPIPQEALRDILEAGRWCGSGKNLQPWQFLLISEKPTLEQLAQMGRFSQHLAEAALGIGLVMDHLTMPKSSALDEGRVAQNLMLAAHAYGIGSCIAFYEDEEIPELTKLLNIPSRNRLQTIISLGYPDEGYLSTSNPLIPGGRKPLAELVHLEKFGNPPT